MKSISLTSRHDFVSLFGCPRLDEADFVDLEVLLYFLQCTSFGGVDRFDPEARIYFCSALTSMGSISLTLRHEFISCSALTSVGSVSLTLRHQFIFCSGSLSDIQTLGLLEIVVALSTLTCFCVCFRISSFPLKWFPASKRSL